MKGMASISQSGAYSQEAFRYLLESESKRSERSGDFCQVLLVYHTNRQGAIVQMDSDVAKTVMAALFRCLRDTDYIGWYRAERVVAGVLTGVRRESVAEVFNCLRPRLWEILLAELGVEESGRLQIRLCQHHELAAVRLGVQSSDVN